MPGPCLLRLGRAVRAVRVAGAGSLAWLLAWLVRLPQRLLLGLVKAYRLLLSPWLGSSCRFEPTCSAYALQALDQHGAAGGSYLTAARLLRCHPACAGGHDAVPERIGAPRWCLVLVRFFAPVFAPVFARVSAFFSACFSALFSARFGAAAKAAPLVPSSSKPPPSYE